MEYITNTHGTFFAFKTKWILCAKGQNRILYKRNSPSTRGGSVEPVTDWGLKN